MRFGAVATDAALGTILAHSVRAGEGRFAKGRVLTATDVAALRAAGIDQVTVAALEADDLGEDEAATRVATRLAGPQMTVSAAFTGRVNLFAAADGLAIIDAAAIQRLNRHHEAVTIATVPPFTPVRRGQMLATVKIIPFGVASATVAALEAMLTGALPVALAPWRGLEVDLVQTHLPGTKESVLDKTAAVLAARLAGCGARLRREQRVAHGQEALTSLLMDMRSAPADLLLLVGASAITDRRDVVPAALMAAGGSVEHLGMPVDPGNLLLLGRIGDRPALGLPGCARSPKLNGVDWVLQRLAAGLQVTAEDVADMGVGGLLAEIEERPQPRNPARQARITALILAGGSSRRMGTENKLLLPLADRPLVRHVAEAALASQADRVLVVTGHDAHAVREALADLPVDWAHAADHGEGLSATLKAGLAALSETADGVLVLLGDMPQVGPSIIDRLIAAFAPAEGRAICVPVSDGARGNPILWDSALVPAMMGLSGDRGARPLLDLFAEQVCEVEMGDPAIHRDVDTPEGYAALTETASRVTGGG